MELTEKLNHKWKGKEGQKGGKLKDKERQNSTNVCKENANTKKTCHIFYNFYRHLPIKKCPENSSAK